MEGRTQQTCLLRENMLSTILISLCSRKTAFESAICPADSLKLCRLCQPLLARSEPPFEVLAQSPCKSKSDDNKSYHPIYIGQGWIRTTVPSREQIYSLSPLATRPPTLIKFSIEFKICP